MHITEILGVYVFGRIHKPDTLLLVVIPLERHRSCELNLS